MILTNLDWYRIQDFGQNRWASDELFKCCGTVLGKKKSYLRLLRRKESPCFAAIQLGHQVVPIAVLHKTASHNAMSQNKKETTVVAK